MSKANIFSSKTNPIPEVRKDLEIIPIRENGNSYLYFQDQRRYATPNLALRREAGPLLSLIDGRKSIHDLKQHVNGNATQKDLMAFIQFLDRNRLLQSAYFNDFAEQTETEYEQARVHKAITAGSSYPADPKALADFLDEAFCEHKTEVAFNKPKALYAPHIDPRIAIDRYVEAFAPIKDIKPKRVVMLATSHYSGWYPELYEDKPFILVNKDFDLPLGNIRRDADAIAALSKRDEDYGIATHDRAHRMEHSLELHLLFLSYLWDHDFTIIPFLVGGLQELLYMKNGRHGELVNLFSTPLNKQFGSDDDTFFLISGDLAHFGQKFGDPQAASTMFDEVNHFDQQFMDHGATNNPAGILKLMRKEMDAYRICGFPPLYTFLSGMPNLQGEIINYDLWDERERESAVTFGSILYSVKN